jgi:hypothetical protein
MPRAYEDLPEEFLDAPSAHAAKIRVRYLVEKCIDDTWVLMARLPSSSEPDQMETLCAALGGKIRVEDVTNHTHVIDQEFE